MGVTLSEEGRARLDKHLDAVEVALAAAGNSRERRRAVVDDLEAQIQEMLVARSATPTLEDVEAVLGEVDPPAAYGSEEKKIQYASETGAVPAKTAARPRNKLKRRTFMKSIVLVALIVCGTLLVMTPAISDYLRARDATELNLALIQRTAPASEGVSIHASFDPMEGMPRFGFWLTGSVAIGFGVIGGFVAFAREWRHEQ